MSPLYSYVFLNLHCADYIIVHNLLLLHINCCLLNNDLILFNEGNIWNFDVW
jgi:hypothetical protein